MSATRPGPRGRGPRGRAGAATGDVIAALAALATPVLLAAAGGACTGSRGGEAQSPVELTIPPIASLPEGGVVASGEPRRDGRCSLRLVASPIAMSTRGCYLDEHVSKGPGLLDVPCEGNGPAEAVFGPQRYKGNLRDGQLELELSTELDWEDGCRWGTHAFISGALGPSGAPGNKSLSWHYKDFVITGTDCSGVCTARTNLQVTSASGRALETPSHDEGDDDDDD
ncbi:MAG: hypothetical protein KF795_01815 [Labilithrix sp.]|nr:hypothetical protein [Labilithrix sp.]